VIARFEVPPAACAPFNAQFNNTSDAGQQFRWDFGDGATSTDINPTHTYAIPGTYTVTLTAIDSATCNITSTIQQTFEVAGSPTAAFTAAPQPPSVNTPVTFTNGSTPDAVRFKWIFGDGDSLETTSRGPVQHDYNTTGTFNACLIAYNQIGCADTVCQPIQALIEVAVDVPNAFTPLSGDINSVVKVRGYGIGKMKFIIWNRWGQKVFESDNKSNGWNGRVNGVLQPMEVYAYTLDVEFTDGTRVTKKGDITLIR
jgi:gliding motility-associated-like protein